jgi:hypothetical protein
MAEIVGLVLGVAGFTALFSTCIECSDIVVAGKAFSEDYEQFCALVSMYHYLLCMALLTYLVLTPASALWPVGRVGFVVEQLYDFARQLWEKNAT